MYPLSTLGRLVLLAAVLLTATSGLADPSPGVNRQAGKIMLQTPQLTLLAQHVVSSDEIQRWEFATITLNVLLETYLDELQSAAHEKASTPARRAKLARWQRATRDMAHQLKEAGNRLADGAAFTVHMDRLEQILIVVDGLTFSVSGPNPSAEKEIENRIIAAFCRYNDCSFLHVEPTPVEPARLAAGGVWELHERQRPAYQVGQNLRCEFNSMSNRQHKARVCSEAAVELLQLGTALQQGREQGYRIDWDRLAENQPTSSAATNLVITAEGGYLQVELPRLASMSRSDWRRMIQALQHGGGQADRMTVIRQADRLVSGTRPD
jgi:hypothetical protein